MVGLSFIFKGVDDLRTYTLTVFEHTGEKLLDETFEAANDEEAKEVGQSTLEDKNFAEHTHRCVSPEAKLLLFHR